MGKICALSHLYVVSKSMFSREPVIWLTSDSGEFNWRDECTVSNAVLAAHHKRVTHSHQDYFSLAIAASLVRLDFNFKGCTLLPIYDQIFFSE